MRSKFVALVSLVITACWFVAGPVPQALANPACTGGALVYDHTGAGFTPADDTVGGIRAPIQARLNGVICDSTAWGSNNPSFTAAWIGVIDEPDNKVAQIGLTHIWANGDAFWCRFWEAGDLDTGATELIYGTPTGGTCVQSGSSGTLTNDIFQYFKVKVIDVSGTKKYQIADCGQSNPSYSSCTDMDTSHTRFGHEQAWVMAESDVSCQNFLMGTQADTQDYGTTTNNLQTMGDYNGNWGANGLDNIGPDICSGTSRYIHHIGTGNQFIYTYDGGN